MARAKTSANDWATRKTREADRAHHIFLWGNYCQICGATPKSRGLQWDHDHKTGAFRGWLCHRCNRALPTWVTPAWLRQAADYLERSAT